MPVRHLVQMKLSVSHRDRRMIFYLPASISRKFSTIIKGVPKAYEHHLIHAIPLCWRPTNRLANLLQVFDKVILMYVANLEKH